ncbi:MAG: hypothetical protein LBI72_03935 [Flavobacteriaceae bacterium]|jgi:hypothetical protein|nr:hypothetical protein [Flavobacteriaceae bacterium]
MKWIAVVCFSLSVFFQTNTSAIRESFEGAGDTAAKAEAFYTQSLKLGDDDVSNAYKGAALITKGKYEKGIKNKKTLIVKGAGLLDKAVENKPKDLEIRLVRLIVQEHLPSIVKYKSNMQEDKQVIVANYSKQTADLKKWISTYAKQSKVFTSDDIKKLL